MTVPNATWVQAIQKALEISEKCWLSPTEICNAIKLQNLKDVRGSTPIHSVKRILYMTCRNDGPFLWDRVKHRFALKTRLNGDNKGKKEETDSASLATIAEEESSSSEEDDNENTSENDVGYYDDDLCSFVVTITPTPPPPLSKKQKKRSGNIKKSSTTSFLPSPIQRALNTLHLLRCETRKPDRLKKTSSATTLGENFEIVATVEYERVFDTTGACVAILSGHCDQRNGGVYEFDPSQPEEVMEDDTNELSSGSVMKDKPGSGREVKKTTLSSSSKPVSQKRPPVEKRKSAADDGSPATINLKSMFTVDNFNKLPYDTRVKLIKLLPVVDRLDESTPTAGAFSHTYFTSACRQWQHMLQSVQLPISQRARQKQEESHKKTVDEWKKQHYEEELSEDAPPQPPNQKIFYPIPLNGEHQKLLDCIKRTCRESLSRNEELTGSSIAIKDSVSNNASEQEVKQLTESTEEAARSPELATRPAMKSPEQVMRSPDRLSSSPELLKSPVRSPERATRSPEPLRSPELSKQVTRSLDQVVTFPMKPLGRPLKLGISSPEPSRSPKPVIRSPELAKQGTRSPELSKQGIRSPELAKQRIRSPEPSKQGIRSPEPSKQGIRSPEPSKQGTRSAEPSKQGIKSPELAKQGTRSLKLLKQGTRSPELAKQRIRSPDPSKQRIRSPELTKQGARSPELAKQGARSPELSKQERPHQRKHELVKSHEQIRRSHEQVRREQTRRSQDLKSSGRLAGKSLVTEVAKRSPDQASGSLLGKLSEQTQQTTTKTIPNESAADRLLADNRVCRLAVTPLKTSPGQQSNGSSNHQLANRPVRQRLTKRRQPVIIPERRILKLPRKHFPNWREQPSHAANSEVPQNIVDLTNKNSISKCDGVKCAQHDNTCANCSEHNDGKCTCTTEHCDSQFASSKHCESKDASSTKHCDNQCTEHGDNQCTEHGDNQCANSKPCDSSSTEHCNSQCAEHCDSECASSTKHRDSECSTEHDSKCTVNCDSTKLCNNDVQDGQNNTMYGKTAGCCGSDVGCDHLSDDKLSNPILPVSTCSNSECALPMNIASSDRDPRLQSTVLGVKRPCVSEDISTKKCCSDGDCENRPDLLSDLPQRFSYNTLYQGLKKCSKDSSNDDEPVLTDLSSKEKTKQIHPILREHSYPVYHDAEMPLLLEQQRVAPPCSVCLDEKMWVCMMCEKVTHSWCLSRPHTYCWDCLSSVGNILIDIK